MLAFSLLLEINRSLKKKKTISNFTNEFNKKKSLTGN